MAKESKIIFQVHSSQVINAFEGNNYKIVYDNQNKDNKLCVIYFSSNEIYYPNTVSSFQYSIIEKDRYEWTYNKIKNAFKHIFVRDLQKQWYIGGINSRMNNPDKLLDFLKTETEGYLVYTVGSSAGGYAALLYGSLLNVKRVYAFNAQLNLFETIRTSNSNKDPIIFDNLDNVELNKFYNLSYFLNNDIDYYYFQSCKSKVDVNQYFSLPENATRKLKSIFFLTSNHGFPFLRINLPYILSFDKKRLDSLVNQKFSLIPFSISLIGFLPTFKFIFKALFDRYKKKKLEKRFTKKHN